MTTTLPGTTRRFFVTEADYAGFNAAVRRDPDLRIVASAPVQVPARGYAVTVNRPSGAQIDDPTVIAFAA